ncbi:response regulator [Parasegetibacter sp. NRK P23]|uniref:response regulator n=1 Tax=Parasegetibacter sp. NRK P23 TaxID=2942999 RepID=UPI0020439C8E|nr:response regulator [Parasegetibacter sp. NRK P23]MCM5529815.1 response regulator [Parasegetibacter sp. NRK P23]
MQTDEIKILLVEDNEGDVILTLEALKEGRIKNSVNVVRDGEQAIFYLDKKEGYADAITPDIILLDINLPRIDGLEVLSYIKQSESLKTIPVVMLTTSSSRNDIQSAYASYANCYITKPVDFNKFMDVIGSIEHFWISLVKLPTH